MPDLLSNPVVRRVVGSLAMLLAAAVVAAIARLLLGPILRRVTARTATDLDDKVAHALRGPVVSAILLTGLYYAVRELALFSRGTLAQIFQVLGTLIVMQAALRVFNVLATSYSETAAEKSARPREIQAQALVGRKVISILILVAGILVILQQLDQPIGPLIAGLGLGGLAVALALQDTLSNLFAGIYMTVDRPVAVGDFVKLESGEEGFIEEIGWRNTKVRMWANNVVIIPNSKLSQSVVTNYYLPRQEMSVYINCGVAYDSDLEHVERVCIEVGKQVMAQVQGSANDWEPVVRYKEFADFSINFVVVLRVHDFSAQYLLAHEYMKALHRRFDQEGIEIPFPIRTVIMHPPRHAAEYQGPPPDHPAASRPEAETGNDDGGTTGIGV